jgi:uncharacterized membrane protein
MSSPADRAAAPVFESRTDSVVPAGGEFTTAWIAYGCYFFGVLLWWPSIIGLVICYVRRDEPGAGFLASHYRWLIRTFWWSTLWWLASIGLIIAGALPIVADVLRSARFKGQRLGDIEIDTLISIDWSSIFAAAGMATLGGMALVAVYLWLVYRLIRGSLRLANGQPAP